MPFCCKLELFCNIWVQKLDVHRFTETPCLAMSWASPRVSYWGGGGARADQLCICIQSIVTFDYLTLASVGGLVQTPMSFSGMATEPLGGLR